MLVPFNSLNENSKIWIYQSSKKMTDNEVEFILKNAENFVDTWTAHQAGLKAGVNILYNTFLIFAVDESHNDASGCSIDKKVHFVKGLEQQTGINFFDRMTIAFLKNNSEIDFVKLSKLNDELESGTLNLHSTVFNNLITSVKQLNTEWKSPLSKTWMMNFVKGKVV